MTALVAQWPGTKWYVHEPSVNPAIASAAKKIAGKPAIVTYDLSKADVIVSLESDFLNYGPGGDGLCPPVRRQTRYRRRPDPGPLVCD